MRELLSLVLVAVVIYLVFAWAGNVDAIEVVKETWAIILDAVSDLGDAWREH